MVITSAAKLPLIVEAMASFNNVSLILVVGGAPAGSDERIRDYATAIADQPTTAIDHELLGTSMLYSSGTTGQPKGIIRPLP